MGALGTIDANGDFDLALTIRTFAVADGRIHLWVGGGIVWDSDPEAEIEESWVKARPLLAAVGGLVPGMTLLAVAVAGRGLVDPDEPVFAADDEALLRGGAAFETRPCLRRPARFCSTATSIGSPIRPRRSRCRRADGAGELVELVRRGGAAGPRAALYRTERALVATGRGAARPISTSCVRAA